MLKDKSRVVAAVCMIIGLGGFLTITGWVAKTAQSNRVEEVFITELDIRIDTQDLKEGSERTDEICEEIKGNLLSQGVEEGWIRIHSQQIERSEERDGVEGTILVTVKRRHRLSNVDMKTAVTDVSVPSAEILRWKSSVKSHQEYLRWAEVTF